MANMNIRTPRFYVDMINYQLSRGVSNSQFYLNSDTGQLNTITTGSSIELFDMRPLNQVVFDTTNNRNEHVVLTFDQNFGSYVTNFVAILNHNMNSSNAKVTIAHDSSTESDVQDTDFGSATAIASVSEVLNADAISSNTITPAEDGHTIITFTNFSSRYIGIQFEGTVNDADDGSSGAYFDANNNLSIGCILVGEYYDMPVSPDLNVQRNIVFDGQNTQESLGGQRYSTLSNYGKKLLSTTNKSPFQTYTGDNKRGLYGGRITYDMKFSYLNSSDVMPSTYNVQTQADNTVVNDVWNMTHGGHIPFIFTQDGSSVGNNAESDYLFARFAQKGLSMTQVAPDVFDVSMKIEEEF